MNQERLSPLRPQERQSEHLSFRETEARALQAFQEVQAFPFDLSNRIKGTVTEKIQHISKECAGSCSAKHYLLSSRLQELGLNTCFLTYPFYWQDMPVRFSPSVRAVLCQMPLQYHLALLVEIRGEAKLLDATWDPPLERVGFPVVHMPDYFDSTCLGINPAGEPKMHSTAYEREVYIDCIKQNMEFNEVVSVFYDRLDKWLKLVRKSSKI